MKPTYGQQIRALRKARSLTQEQLANKTGIAINSIRRYESDERSPTMDVLARLAAAFDVPPAILLGGVDQENFDAFQALSRRRTLSNAFTRFCEASGFSEGPKGNKGDVWFVTDPDGNESTLNATQFAEYKSYMQDRTMEYLMFLHQQFIKKVRNDEI